MKKVSIGIATAIILSATLFVPEASAIHKLGFWDPIVDFAHKVQKTKEKIEEQYTAVLEKQNEKIKKATGAEGAALFKAVVPQNLGDIRKGIVQKLLAGQWDFDSLLKGALPKLANMKLDWASFKQLSQDYDRALKAEKLAKDKEIDAELTKLYAEVNLYQQQKDVYNLDELQQLLVENPNDEKLEEYAQKIAALEEQKSTNVNPTAKKFEDEMKDLNKKIRENNREIMDTQMFKDLTSKTDDLISGLFSKKADDAETKDLYNQNIAKLFLGKYELVNAENVNRIMKNRKQEYYHAVVNMLEIALEGDGHTMKIADDSQNMKEAMTEVAEGNYGAKDMEIGTDIETAKAAARYMQLLLAKLRLDTTRTLQSWTDYYKLKDYSKYTKDEIKFSLDDYILNDSKIAQLKGLAKGKAQDAIDNFKF